MNEEDVNKLLDLIEENIWMILKIVKNIKLFIYSLDNIVINIPNKDKVIKEKLYNTSYDILYLVYRCVL